MLRNYRRLVAALSLLLIACASVTRAAAWGEVSPEEWSLQPPADWNDLNSAILFDHGTLRVSTEGTSMHRHVRMKVLTKAGIDEIGNTHIYYKASDKLTEVQAQTIFPDGRIETVDPNDILTKSYGGQRLGLFAFPSVDSGCVLEYRYTVSSKNVGILPPWYFQSEQYTFESRFELELAPGFIYSSVHNRPVADTSRPVEEAFFVGNMGIQIYHRYTWTQEDLPPVTTEPFMAARSDYCSALSCQLSEYRTSRRSIRFIKGWTDLGHELTGTFLKYAKGRGTGKLVEDLISSRGTQEEQSRTLYEYVAEAITTQPDPEGGWFSNKDIGALLKTKAGTAIEKNLLLWQLLRKAGIEAWPILIATRDYGQLDPNSCHLSQFNHMIVYARPDSAAMMLDASSRYCPYSLLPANCLVDLGFLVDDDIPKIIRITRADLRTYRLDATDIEIDSTGSARCTTTCQMTGYFAPQFGELCDRMTPRRFAEEYLLADFSRSAAVDSCAMVLNNDGRLDITTRYTLSNHARMLDDNTLIQPPVFFLSASPFKRERRSFPVDFNYPFTYHNVVRVTLSAEATSVTLPRDTTFEIPGIAYRRACMFNQGMAIVDSRLTVTEPLFPPNRYADLRRFFEQVEQVQGESMILSHEL